MFSEFDGALRENVLVAGGAVLACVVPPHPLYARLNPEGYASSSDFEFAFTSTPYRMKDPHAPDATLAQYYQSCRWPDGDIDIFM